MKNWYFWTLMFLFVITAIIAVWSMAMPLAGLLLFIALLMKIEAYRQECKETKHPSAI